MDENRSRRLLMRMELLAAILVAALLFALPSIIAQWRRVRAFRSISALNGLMIFTFVCGFLLDAVWLWWATAALWVLTMVWASAGGQRDAAPPKD